MADYQSDRNTDEVNIRTDPDGETLTAEETIDLARGLIEAANFADPKMDDGHTTVIEAIGLDPGDMTEGERDSLSIQIHEYISQHIGRDTIADERGLHPDELFLGVAVEAPDEE